MDLKDIKQQLTINQVLSHYNLKPDKNQRLLCPFHPDKTPSLQIYPATNTYCCFSSNCNAGTGDMIQFFFPPESSKFTTSQPMSHPGCVCWLWTRRYSLTVLLNLYLPVRNN